MQIQISWLLQKPSDLGLHCLQRQGISGSAGYIHVYLQTSRFQLVLSYNGEDTYVFYTYEKDEMKFQYGDAYIGYVANGNIVRKENSVDGSFLRRADINIIESGKCFRQMTVQSTLIISTSLISNIHLSRSENLVPVLTQRSTNRQQNIVEKWRKFLLFSKIFSIYLKLISQITYSFC